MMRVLYTENPFEEKETLKLLISVPKKNIPLAVNRNRIKRLIREAYRHHYETLEQLLKGQNKHFLLAFIFFGKEVPSSSDVQFWVAKAMAELKSNLK